MTNDRSSRRARAEQQRKEVEKAEKRQRNIISIVILAVVVTLVGVGGWGINRAMGQNERVTEVIQPADTLDDFGVVYGGASSADTEGASSEDAAAAGELVRVELFEDFLCPHCGQFEAVNGAFLRGLADEGAIELVYRPFSFMHTASTNDYSRRATNLAFCALDQGGIEDYALIHDALYTNQPAGGGPGPSNADLLTMASDVGVEGLDECVRTGRFIPWIDEAREHGASERNVTGTPTVFINGEVSQAASPESLQAAITAAAGA